MSTCKAYIDSLYHGSAVDGAGLRSVVFFAGCNLRCGFCHNPETLYRPGQEMDLQTMLEKLRRYIPYIRKGGVTLSGGEPFLQADFCVQLIRELHQSNLHVCIETNGHLIDEALLDRTDSIILDIKNQDGSIPAENFAFLDACQHRGIPVQITNVLVPGRNDTAAHIAPLNALTAQYSCVEGIKFLPFRKLCLHKYEALGMAYPYDAYPEASEADVARAKGLLEEAAN